MEKEEAYQAAINYLQSKGLSLQNLEVVKLYEYQARDVLAIKPPKNLSIPEEAEIVTGGMPLNQLVSYREVFVITVKEVVRNSVERHQFIGFLEWQRLN